MIELSVIICAHNPRRDYLERVLEALRAQSLGRERWELLLVDNASRPPLSLEIDAGWHPSFRVVPEDSLGLTRARLRGIRQARAETLVFVDDDNVVRPDYLEQAQRLAAASPRLGAWGGGVSLEFEATPPEWTRRYWYLLAERVVDRDAQSDVAGDLASTPFGAGLCVRREVAAHYADQLERNAWRQALGRCGGGLLSCEDIDLALTACDLGLEKGVFACLQLVHLIPPRRLEEDYLVRLYEGAELGARLLEHLRPGVSRPRAIGFRWWSKCLYDLARRRGRERRFFVARKRAEHRAWKTAKLMASAPDKARAVLQTASAA